MWLTCRAGIGLGVGLLALVLVELLADLGHDHRQVVA